MVAMTIAILVFEVKDEMMMLAKYRLHSEDALCFAIVVDYNY